jgi:hypothetical protein
MELKNKGLIGGCSARSNQCKYKCCKFDKNFIVLLPGEYEASAKGKGHLKIIDHDYHGGKKAVCVRKCEKGDLKPIDCQSYPYFPSVDETGSMRLLFGNKCPLRKKELAEHREGFMEFWSGVLKDTAILNFVRNVKLIGYEYEG